MADPKRLAGLMNFTLAPNGRTYLSDDPEKLPQRVINLVHVLARTEVERLSLREAMRAAESIVSNVRKALATSPEIAALDEDEAYFTANRLMLRNASLVNFLDGCAITLPCHAAGTAPVGLSLVASNNHDRRLLAVARTVAPLIAAP